MTSCPFSRYLSTVRSEPPVVMPNDFIHVFTFKAPDALDLKALRNSTKAALKMLVPYCEPGRTGAIHPLSRIAQAYVRAIWLSVDAARQAYIIAGDAIALSKHVQGQKPPKELDNYARGMLALATKAEGTTQQVLTDFREVRQKVLSLIEKKKDSGNNKLVQALLRFTGHQSPLQQFESNITKYINWWTWIDLENGAQRASVEHLTFDYGALRNEEVVLKWGEIQGNFLNYFIEIVRLHDKSSTLLSITGAVRSNG
ncbi:hypothetical protein B0H34DRAFT_719190 [Crassisporium funariophilum]|nr:hypothetical protein B0H34DRAFT_719190 [Crassisporium funariophilum]